MYSLGGADEKSLAVTVARHASGEFEASQKLADAAKVLETEPAAIQLRYLQTLTEIGVEKNTTVVFPLPIDIVNTWVRSLAK